MPPFRKHWLAFCVLGPLAALPVSTATAEGDKLETAQTKLTEALQALKDAPAQGDPAKFEDHRKKAITLLTRAQGEILKAKGVQAPK